MIRTVPLATNSRRLADSWRRRRGGRRNARRTLHRSFERPWPWRPQQGWYVRMTAELAARKAPRLTIVLPPGLLMNRSPVRSSSLDSLFFPAGNRFALAQYRHWRSCSLEQPTRIQSHLVSCGLKPLYVATLTGTLLSRCPVRALSCVCVCVLRATRNCNVYIYV